MVAWGLSLGAGVHSLMRYETTPGPIVQAIDRWPAGISLLPDEARPTLVMLVHPNCPCTRASISELNILMSDCPGAMTAYVVFERPVGMQEDPATADLWRSATRIHGVRAIIDDGAFMGHAFNAETSGEVFVYDKTGSLCFSGGITESRGHAGDNDGRSAIEAILHSAKPAHNHTPVFGCSLR